MAGISGKFGMMQPQEVLAVVANNRLTGVLRIESDDRTVSGGLIYRNGNLIDAECGAVTGEDAAYILLAARDNWTFRFDKRGVLRDVAIKTPAGSLALEAMRISDTKRRVASILPDERAVPYLRVDDLSKCKGLKLYEEDKAVAAAITGDRDFHEIAAATGTKVLEVMKTAVQLLEADVIGVVSPLAQGRLVSRRGILFGKRSVILPGRLEAWWRGMEPYKSVAMDSFWLIPDQSGRRILVENVKFDPKVTTDEFAIPEARLEEWGVAPGAVVRLKPVLRKNA